MVGLGQFAAGDMGDRLRLGRAVDSHDVGGGGHRLHLFEQTRRNGGAASEQLRETRESQSAFGAVTS